MYNLFLDDKRTPESTYLYTNKSVYKDLKWVIVRDYDEFVKYITENGMPNLISFDHDLADVHYGMHDDIIYEDMYDMMEEFTGYHCAKWLINYCMDHNYMSPPNYLVHSMNGPGSANIRYLIENYKRFLLKKS